MLDISLFRPDKGGDPEAVRASQRKRFADEALVDRVVELDQAWRQAKYDVEQLSRKFNALNKEVAQLKKAKQDASHLMEQSKAIRTQVEQASEAERAAASARDATLQLIGNVVHDSVPVHNDEAHNTVAAEVGTRRGRSTDLTGEEWLQSHPDLVNRLGFVNLDAGQAVAGSRGYYLMNEGALLNQALVSYGLHFLSQRGFTPVHTPFFMNREVMAQCAQLSQFDDELYGLVEGGHDASSSRDQQGQQQQQQQQQPAASSSGSSSIHRSGHSHVHSDKYLIATSEQPLCALHRQGWIEPSDLPLRYAGFSTCFRREVGSHGKDTLGIFRVHQFEKVEQFCLTSPEGGVSWEMFDQMVRNAGDFYSSLGIPYRLVNIVSGALNSAASKKVDLEGWFPASGAYRELVSCSNCTDYQARRLDVRMRLPTAPKASGTSGSAAGGGGTSAAAAQSAAARSAYVHMLNCTLTATQRTLCCIIENHQTKEGIKIPAPLQPFLMGRDFIPFRQAAGKVGRLVGGVVKAVR